MRVLISLIVSLMTLFSCSHGDAVQISGRIENGDSIVSIWVEDSIYTFPLDDHDFFSGKVMLKNSGYATLLQNSLNLYLSPGEDLEIYFNAKNLSGSLYFRGSLGGINSYLKEQEVAVFFDRNDYTLPEPVFIRKMQALIDEKTKLLEAKNFDDSFTRLEKNRIKYSIAERVSFYPTYQKRMMMNRDYRPSKEFLNYLSSFSLNDEKLFGTKDYRSFLLNYVYLQGDYKRENGGDYSNEIADYILSTVTNPKIKDFLLMEIVYRYIRENNGLDGVDYLLSVFRRECSDRSKVAYIDELITHWEKLTAGAPAPDFQVEDVNGQKISLSDFKGSYVYITVWATWCVPCKSELPYINLLQEAYMGRNINFLTVAIDGASHREQWLNFLKENKYAGTHTLTDPSGKFNENYMIISIPRFILIGPDGNIVTSNAPRPSGAIRQLFDSLNI